MNDYVIEVKQIMKSYGSLLVLDHVNIHVKRGDIYGLVGDNGAGKSTLLKLLAGHSYATEGEPQLLVLDEPINGLDPSGIIEFRNLLRRLNEERNITILLSSHILAELQQIATMYGFLSKGVLIEEIREERRKYEKREKEFQKQIENISHDLRTPLTVILGYFQNFKGISYG